MDVFRSDLSLLLLVFSLVDRKFISPQPSTFSNEMLIFINELAHTALMHDVIYTHTHTTTTYRVYVCVAKGPAVAHTPKDQKT